MKNNINEISKEMGLDPRMGYLMELHGNVYIKASGLQEIANQSGEFNGCQVDIVREDWESGHEFFIIKARVYKKGCDQPFEDFADSYGSNLKGGNKFRHTITRAKARALRTAFSVPFCSVEELDDDLRFKKRNPSAPKSNWVEPRAEDQDEWKRASKRFFAIVDSLSIPQEEAKSIVYHQYSVNSTRDMTTPNFARPEPN